MRPRLLDLYACEGGASAGYHRAGFDVFGVDLFEDYTQKRYPFESHKGDAVEFVKAHGHEFDVIHASPPCQHASAGTRALRGAGTHTYPELIGPTRDALIASGKPYVIENVKGSALEHPLMLCGRQFNLTATDDDGTELHLDRHRMFESNVALLTPPTCSPHDRTLQVGGSYGGARRDKAEARNVRHGGYVPSTAVQQQLLGIDWMTQKGMHQALPPVYTEFLGHQLRTALTLGAVA
jgi:DNA (cytosine-5)-methyltransferase 1